MWAVMKLVKWESLVATGFPYMPLSCENKACIGMLPVFENKEEALREHPGCEVLQIVEIDRPLLPAPE